MNEGLAHLVGDYVIQSDWMARAKTSSHIPAALHGATYAACFLPLTRDPRALAIIGGTHYLIDRYRLAKHVTWLKNQVAPKGERPGHTATGYRGDMPDFMSVWLLIIADNVMHLAINHYTLRRFSK